MARSGPPRGTYNDSEPTIDRLKKRGSKMMQGMRKSIGSLLHDKKKEAEELERQRQRFESLGESSKLERQRQDWH